MSMRNAPPVIINTGASRNDCKLPEWDAALKQQRTQAAAPSTAKRTHAGSMSSNDASSSQPTTKKRVKVDYSTLANDPPSQPLAKTVPKSAATKHTTTRPALRRQATPPMPRQTPPPSMPRTTPPPSMPRTTPPPRSCISSILAQRNRTPPARARGPTSRINKQAALGRALAVVPSDKSGPTRAQQATAQMQEALARMRAKNGGGGVGGKGKAEGGVHGKAGSGSSMEPHAAGRPTTSHSNNRMQAVSAAAPAVKGPSTTGSIKHRPQGSSTKQQGPSKHLPHNKYNDDDDQGDWRAALRAVTGYDPGRYRDAGNDRMMEASVQDIMREERRSAVLGKQADIEAERAEEERKRAKKLAKKRKLQQG